MRSRSSQRRVRTERSITALDRVVNGVHVEEVGCQQPFGLGAQECPPLRIDTAWGRSDPGGGEDASDGAGADPVAEADQLALDSAVPPRRTRRA
jgi:hypothetical protein